jgi:hypothetical protein
MPSADKKKLSEERNITGRMDVTSSLIRNLANRVLRWYGRFFSNKTQV